MHESCHISIGVEGGMQGLRRPRISTNIFLSILERSECWYFERSVIGWHLSFHTGISLPSHVNDTNTANGYLTGSVTVRPSITRVHKTACTGLRTMRSSTHLRLHSTHSSITHHILSQHTHTSPYTLRNVAFYIPHIILSSIHLRTHLRSVQKYPRDQCLRS